MSNQKEGVFWVINGELYAYPRGRVVINSRGKVIVYMNHNIDEAVLGDIKKEFGLTENPRIIYDGSKHYKCYLD